MGKEKSVSGNTTPLHGRPVTRAIVSALRASSKMITSSEVAATTTQINQGLVLRSKNSKRTALDEKKANAHKKQAVLKDITNVNSYTSCFNAAKIQVENIKQKKKERASSSMVESSSATSEVTYEKVEVWSKSTGSSTVASIPKFVDIDSDDKDHLLCCLYAPEIYNNLRVAELKRRPFPDFMERTQRDVTQTMRGILVDWLVEVAEEYTLVPDTLYLTVYLIDWYLHGNYMERQRLQLLGITCMLIASKYEEICAPRIEEFCFISDNAYTGDQVLEMESLVVKHSSFQIYAPTPKTFLRRFLRAAQASHPNPSQEMEFLANYLTELTLLDYQFLKFLPSIIAASAIFLANWTMNQFSHPWNPTLEHYTMYKASDLKASVQALQDLQLNTKGCLLNSIRMKYRQEKFKCVAVYTSPKLHDKLF
ncbi:hypothetical protein EUTSA_v10013650mg [Eutrema salsugineum]|uniref:Cyclin N-terminal domain-containing protein n=1 Tax=Eutrema salsugineum TaxID=72664 RepID=V4LUN5_EUTSA|nr:cyclin-A2-4 [Eutrema salsugineum]XP_024011941.1 cyclin-A2-4 [Eutrema salsugineum]ESQ43588.1 hypothetical protein EUTSA_v10013650mg [Eutrema salsugineum]